MTYPRRDLGPGAFEYTVRKRKARRARYVVHDGQVDNVTRSEPGPAQQVPARVPDDAPQDTGKPAGRKGGGKAEGEAAD